MFHSKLARGSAPGGLQGDEKRPVSRADPCLLPRWLVRSLTAFSPPGDQGSQARLRDRELRILCSVGCVSRDFSRRISERDSEDTSLHRQEAFLSFVLTAAFQGA